MIQQHWNKVVRKQSGNGVKKRDYISFSDLGKGFIDRYYKMKGEAPTNAYDERVLRIFDAGRVMEFIVLRALTMSGILNQKQKYVEIPATKDVVKQLGYLDCTIGGFVNYDNAKQIIQKHLQEYKLNLDDQLIEQKAINIIDGLKTDFPNGTIEEMLVEVKSINSMAFWAHKNRDANGNFLGYPHNKLQLYGYQKATQINKGILLYISKDDFVIEELCTILGNEELETKYNDDVKKMSYYYLNNEVPPKEKEIVYNDKKDLFELNWQVSRSGYLTKIYGYKDGKDFDEKNHQTLLGINLALKHLREFRKEKDEKKKATLQKKLTNEEGVIKNWKLETFI